jgi:polyferredoxin
MAMLTVIGVLTLVGPKLFCSYICPVGAVQELAASFSTNKKIKQWRINFSVLNGIRVSVFLIFLVFSVTKIYHIVYKGQVYGLSVYDKINPFHGFEFQSAQTYLGTFLHYLPLILTILLAFKMYRPFCYAVCPIGLFSNILEQLGLNRLTFVKNNCNDCNLCVTKTACPAISEILKSSEFRPDCFACNRCITSCNQNALRYGIKKTEN